MIDTAQLRKGSEGGFAKGERHPLSKLTEEDVLGLVHLYAEGYSVASLARAVGVTPGAVWQILRGTTWGWLTGIGQQSEEDGGVDVNRE